MVLACVNDWLRGKKKADFKSLHRNAKTGSAFRNNYVKLFFAWYFYTILKSMNTKKLFCMASLVRVTKDWL
jgi:hypothetical protein